MLVKLSCLSCVLSASETWTACGFESNERYVFPVYLNKGTPLTASGGFSVMKGMGVAILPLKS